MGQEFNPPLRYHIIPLYDLREHDASPECWCHPTPDEEHDYYLHRLAHERAGAFTVDLEFIKLIEPPVTYIEE